MTFAFLMMNPFHHRLYKGEANGGEYNGYVAFDKELPLSYQGGASWESDYNLDKLIDVHGGITFDHEMSGLENSPIIPLTAIPSPEEFKNFRVIGFDTLHYDDTREKWPIEKIKEETMRLKAQIDALKL